MMLKIDYHGRERIVSALNLLDKRKRPGRIFPPFSFFDGEIVEYPPDKVYPPAGTISFEEAKQRIEGAGLPFDRIIYGREPLESLLPKAGE